MHKEAYQNHFPERLAKCLAQVDQPIYYNNDSFIKHLHESWKADCICYLKGRGICAIQRFAFTTAIVYGYQYLDYVGRYCYQIKAEAVEALNNWNGIDDPGGDWIKHKGIFEYSNPNNQQ